MKRNKKIVIPDDAIASTSSAPTPQPMPEPESSSTPVVPEAPPKTIELRGEDPANVIIEQPSDDTAQSFPISEELQIAPSLSPEDMKAHNANIKKCLE